MVCSSSGLARKAKKKLLKTGLRFEFQLKVFKCYSHKGITLALNLTGLLQKFSPWEVVRHDVVFPVRFFGHVEVHPTGS